MSKRIQDQFTNLPVSRQVRYQMRHMARKLCMLCAEPAVSACYCLKHMIVARERQRKEKGLKRRNLNSPSYRLEADAARAKA